MTGQFEGAKGVAEKVLAVRFPVIMRVFLPGALALIACNREMQALFDLIPSNAEFWMKAALIGIALFTLGVIVSCFSNKLYEIYEGRILWPSWVFKLGTRLQAKRVGRLSSAAHAASGPSYNELWYKLRIYPLNEKGEPEATHPTLLGNILAGYEQYPFLRYGMDSVFYWPRIWLVVEKEKKDEIDEQWSIADGVLLLSAVSFFSALLWIVESVLAALCVFRFTLVAHVAYHLLAAAGWILLGYALYRFSLPYHRDNGERFKAIFDLYRQKLVAMTSIEDKDVWLSNWSYLQYYRFVCQKCHKSNFAGAKMCTACGASLESERTKLSHTEEP